MSANSGEIIQFVTELRSRLMHALIVFFVACLILLYFANQLYTWFADPLLRLLPQKHFIATQMTAPFFVPFKLACFAAFLCVVPYFFYQLWSFISPALYGYERRLVWPSLLLSIFLFYLGIAFAYTIIFPLLFHFLIQTTPSGVQFQPDMHDYLNFTMTLLLIFGVLFEIPLVVAWCIAKGWVPREKFIKMRPFAILGAFIVGMFLAPPDVLSQTILAIPIWLLYEMGIVLSRLLR